MIDELAIFYFIWLFPSYFLPPLDDPAYILDLFFLNSLTSCRRALYFTCGSHLAFLGSFFFLIVFSPIILLRGSTALCGVNW